MSHTLHEGGLFAERYQIVRCIATGGMGAVYEVVHLETARRRALKVMHPHVLQSDNLRERFKREAKVAANIESEFIVDVFDAGVDAATQMPFLAMELLRGEEIGHRLARVGRFSPEETLTYLQQTALALDKTHKASIIHRDLKPANLFLTERDDGSPRIKVLDFGIAKIIADSGTQANAPTSNLGTPLYMSPEQFRTGEKLTRAVDIYALGMMAYAFLVGESYWTKDAEADSNIYAFVNVASRGTQEPASVRAARKQVRLPVGFDAWFAKVVAFDPAARFATATMAVSALAEVFGMALHAVSAPTSSARTSLGSPPSSGVASSPVLTGDAITGAPVERRKGSTIVALSLGLIVIGGGLFFAARLARAPSSAAASEGAVLAVQTASAPVLAVSVERIATAPAVEPAVTLVEPAGTAPEPTASATGTPRQGLPVKPTGNLAVVSSGTSAPAKTAAPVDSAKRRLLYSRE